jgi:hypothetical protein
VLETAAVRIDARDCSVKFVGVGNIAAHLRARGDGGGRGLVSHNGIVGGEVRKIQEFSYDCPEDGLLVVHSDGLQGRWSRKPNASLLRGTRQSLRAFCIATSHAAATMSRSRSYGFPWQE